MSRFQGISIFAVRRMRTLRPSLAPKRFSSDARRPYQLWNDIRKIVPATIAQSSRRTFSPRVQGLMFRTGVATWCGLWVRELRFPNRTHGLETRVTGEGRAAPPSHGLSTRAGDSHFAAASSSAGADLPVAAPLPLPLPLPLPFV